MNNYQNQNRNNNHKNRDASREGGKGHELPSCPDFNLYEDPANRIVGKALYGETAEKIAESFKTISKTRLRRFFDEVKAISRKPGFIENFDKEEAEIILLKSKVAYMIGRASVKEKAGLKNLKVFFDKGLKQVNDGASYMVFMTLFEAAYGYFYETAEDVVR